MPKPTKLEQLQIRVTRNQKREIMRCARSAGVTMSDYVLRRVLPDTQQQFLTLVEGVGENARFVLADLNDLLTALSADELQIAVSQYPPAKLSAYYQNYIAAMVELACARRKIEPPAWTREVEPLPQPVFGSDLLSLRLHLLRSSPPPFRNRNIFIDTSLGGRV